MKLFVQLHLKGTSVARDVRPREEVQTVQRLDSSRQNPNVTDWTPHTDDVPAGSCWSLMYHEVYSIQQHLTRL